MWNCASFLLLSKLKLLRFFNSLTIRFLPFTSLLTSLNFLSWRLSNFKYALNVRAFVTTSIISFPPFSLKEMVILTKLLSTMKVTIKTVKLLPISFKSMFWLEKVAREINSWIISLSTLLFPLQPFVPIVRLALVL